MIIVVGAKSMVSTNDSVIFNCPESGGRYSYKHIRVRRFFTFFFIPVLPLYQQGENIECQRCHNRFKPCVLQYVPEAGGVEFEAAFVLALKQALVAMLWSDGEADEREIEMVCTIYEKMTGKKILREALGLEHGYSTREEAAMLEGLRKFSTHLNDHGKKMAMRVLLAVAAADEKIQDQEKVLLLKIDQAIRFSGPDLE